MKYLWLLILWIAVLAMLGATHEAGSGIGVFCFIGLLVATYKTIVGKD